MYHQVICHLWDQRQLPLLNQDQQLYCRLRATLWPFISLLVVAIVTPTMAMDKPKQNYALVIGNQNYIAAPLQNPISDASAIAKKLQSFGFIVSQHTDTTLSELTEAIFEFYRAIPKGRQEDVVALIYYAGHAVQLQGQNYLVPLGVSHDSAEMFPGA